MRGATSARARVVVAPGHLDGERDVVEARPRQPSYQPSSAPTTRTRVVVAQRVEGGGRPGPGRPPAGRPARARGGRERRVVAARRHRHPAASSTRTRSATGGRHQQRPDALGVRGAAVHGVRAPRHRPGWRCRAGRPPRRRPARGAAPGSSSACATTYRGRAPDATGPGSARGVVGDGRRARRPRRGSSRGCRGAGRRGPGPRRGAAVDDGSLRIPSGMRRRSHRSSSSSTRPLSPGSRARSTGVYAGLGGPQLLARAGCGRSGGPGPGPPRCPRSDSMRSASSSSPICCSTWLGAVTRSMARSRLSRHSPRASWCWPRSATQRRGARAGEGADEGSTAPTRSWRRFGLGGRCRGEQAAVGEPGRTDGRRRCLGTC